MTYLSRLILASSITFAGFVGTAEAATFNGYQYQLTSSEMTWTAAESEAVAKGGHLTDVLSPAEESFLESTFLIGPLATRPLWIGFSDAALEGNFVWSSGRPVTYTNWRAGEPNNTNGQEDYTAMNWHHAASSIYPFGQWNDVPNSGVFTEGNTAGLYYGIIKSPVPEPTIFTLLIAGIGLIIILSKRERKPHRQFRGMQ